MKCLLDCQSGRTIRDFVSLTPFIFGESLLPPFKIMQRYCKLCLQNALVITPTTTVILIGIKKKCMEVK